MKFAKKILSVSAASLAAIILFGCSQGSASQKPTVTDFSANAVLTYNGGEQEQAFLTSDLKGISLIMNSGNLEGLKYSCDGKTTEVSLDDLSVKNSVDGFPSSAPLALYNSISALRANKSLSVSSDNDGIVYSGKNGSGTFSALVDSSSGCIKKIEYKNISFSAVLSDVKEYK